MSNQPEIYNTIIIGGGCAGLSAAIYCGRANLNPLVFTGTLENKGGLLVKTSIVENYSGFPDGILGYDLMVNMENQAAKYNSKIIENEIIEVDFTKKPFMLKDNENNIYYTKSVIIATGSTPNKLNLPNEKNLWARGISSCAVCDGALYKNKKIVVVGGGDSACEEALFLTKFSEVTLILRSNIFRASKIMTDRVLKNKRITVIYNTIVTELIGEDSLISIKTRNTTTNEEQEIKVDGLFYGLGLKPNSTLFKNKLDMDEDGYIKRYEETQTSLEGVYVAGDVVDRKYKQAIVASGDAVKAALDVINYLAETS